MKSRTRDEQPPVTVYTDIEARHEAQLQRQDEEFASYAARKNEITETLETADEDYRSDISDLFSDLNPLDYGDYR